MWPSAAVGAAARSGDVARLQWLQEHGCYFVTDKQVLMQGLESGLSVAEWLVDEVGCPLPNPQDANAWSSLLYHAALSGDVTRLHWLQARAIDLLVAAAFHGHLELVLLLHHEMGDAVLQPEVMSAAVRSGSVKTAAYLPPELQLPMG